MEKLVFIVCLLNIITITTASPSSATKQYRNDYEYNRKTDAFYKLHIEAQRMWQVRDACAVEGAALMVPKDDADMIQLHAMLKKYPDIGDFVWVEEDRHIQTAELDAIYEWKPEAENDWTLESDDCEVMSRDGVVLLQSCNQQLPFICKVAARDAYYDRQCDVKSKGYKYYASVSSCYKIPRIAYTWSQAYSECESEGAHLAVINSKIEQEALTNLTNTEERVKGSRTSYFFFVGVRADPPVGNAKKVFKTIFNQTLEEAGFSEWGENEPNNYMGRENCGTIFKGDGKLNDVECTHEYAFICEKEVTSR